LFICRHFQPILTRIQLFQTCYQHQNLHCASAYIRSRGAEVRRWGWKWSDVCILRPLPIQLQDPRWDNWLLESLRLTSYMYHTEMYIFNDKIKIILHSLKLRSYAEPSVYTISFNILIVINFSPISHNIFLNPKMVCLISFFNYYDTISENTWGMNENYIL